jgi:hypothetical protein
MIQIKAQFHARNAVTQQEIELVQQLFDAILFH